MSYHEDVQINWEDVNGCYSLKYNVWQSWTVINSNDRHPFKNAHQEFIYIFHLVETTKFYRVTPRILYFSLLSCMLHLNQANNCIFELSTWHAMTLSTHSWHANMYNQPSLDKIFWLNVLPYNWHIIVACIRTTLALCLTAINNDLSMQRKAGQLSSC